MAHYNEVLNVLSKFDAQATSIQKTLNTTYPG